MERLTKSAEPTEENCQKIEVAIFEVSTLNINEIFRAISSKSDGFAEIFEAQGTYQKFLVHTP